MGSSGNGSSAAGDGGKRSRPTQDEYYLGLALAVSWRASCLGRSVGAVVVRENRILATGYNGTPGGWPNCQDEDGCPRCRRRHLGQDDSVSRHLDECVCVHAEANAIVTAARFGASLDGSEIYVTDQPCLQCAKELLQVGITRLTYLRGYDVADSGNTEGRRVLAVHHQLMRDLRARKYTETDIGQELATFARLVTETENGNLGSARSSTALDDDQYKSELRPVRKRRAPANGDRNGSPPVKR